MRFYLFLLEAAQATVLYWKYWWVSIGLDETLSFEHHSSEVEHYHLQFIPMPAPFCLYWQGRPQALAFLLTLIRRHTCVTLDTEATGEAFWNSCTWASHSSPRFHETVFVSLGVCWDTGVSALPTFEHRTEEREIISLQPRGSFCVSRCPTACAQVVLSVFCSRVFSGVWPKEYRKIEFCLILFCCISKY